MSSQSAADPPAGTVVITGGSRGIGAEVARRAARGGAPVAILYRTRADAAGAVVADIAADGGRAVAIAADVTDEAQDRKSTRLNSSHVSESRMPSSA